jgi:hypothetical protein
MAPSSQAPSIPKIISDQEFLEKTVLIKMGLNIYIAVHKSGELKTNYRKLRINLLEHSRRIAESQPSIRLSSPTLCESESRKVAERPDKYDFVVWRSDLQGLSSTAIVAAKNMPRTIRNDSSRDGVRTSGAKSETSIGRESDTVTDRGTMESISLACVPATSPGN